VVHHDRYIRERIIALAEKGGLSASTAGELHGVPMSTAIEWLRKSRKDGQVERRKGTELWRVSSAPQDAALVAEAERNPFSKLLLAFLGKETRLFQDLRQQVSGNGMLW